MTIVADALVWFGVAVAAFLIGLIALGLFERFVPRRVLRAYQKHVGAPLMRGTAGIVPGWGLVETVGRRTGNLHRVPVGGRLIGDSYFFLSGTATDTQYVKNIAANPNVRVRVGGRWRTGNACLCPDDDSRKRLLTLNPVNGLFLWTTGFDLLTVRVDLDPR